MQPSKIVFPDVDTPLKFSLLLLVVARSPYLEEEGPEDRIHPVERTPEQKHPKQEGHSEKPSDLQRTQKTEHSWAAY
jgi:hypothetical protein